MEYAPRTFSFPEIKGLSSEQLKLHIGLYEGYVKHTNLLMAQMRDLASEGDRYAYTIAELRRRLGFEWNGMRLHELYFEPLEHGPKTLLADNPLYKAFNAQYGGFSKWLDIFSKVSARGPGWALLTYDPRAKHFFHVWVADHEVGQLATLPILIALDHWEHAYLKDYAPSEKTSYVEAYLKALVWNLIAERFERACA